MEQKEMKFKDLLENNLRIGARRTTGLPLSRPSVLEGIEQYLFLMIHTESIRGQAAQPEQIKETMKAVEMDEETAWMKRIALQTGRSFLH